MNKHRHCIASNQKTNTPTVVAETTRTRSKASSSVAHHVARSVCTDLFALCLTHLVVVIAVLYCGVVQAQVAAYCNVKGVSRNVNIEFNGDSRTTPTPKVAI